MRIISNTHVGVGLIDYLVMPSEDLKTGETYPAFGVANDEKKQYKKLDTGGNVIKDVLWIIKANSEINFIGYTNLLTQMSSGKLDFLLEERDAKSAMMDTEVGKKMSIESRNDKLKPFVLTTILKAELLNLAQSETGIQFKLEPISRGIGKDKVSALMYGMYVIKTIEDDAKQKRKGSMSDFMFIN